MRSTAIRWSCFMVLASCNALQPGDDAGADRVMTETAVDAVVDGGAGVVDAIVAPDVLDASPGIDVTRDVATSCALTPSGAVTASSDGQTIENLRIEVTSGDAISVSHHTNVTIRNVDIRHCGGSGIRFDNANGIHIDHVSITNTCAPATGALPDEQNSVTGEFTTGVVISNLRVENGSSGVYLNTCAAAHLSFIEGHQVRGPFPRGQLVQFNHCDEAVLEDFSCENTASVAWPEDLVSVYYSNRVTVQRGMLDGNNSTSGDGVMFEHSDDGLCVDVDAIHQSNGCFAAYPGNRDVFRNTRCRDIICTDQGRGVPLSNGLAWAGSPDSTALRIESSTYHALCGGTVWDQSVFDAREVTDADFTPRAPQRVSFCWAM